MMIYLWCVNYRRESLVVLFLLGYLSILFLNIAALVMITKSKEKDVSNLLPVRLKKRFLKDILILNIMFLIAI